MRRLLTGKNKCLGNCKDKKGKRRRSKKKKREKEVCANFVRTSNRESYNLPLSVAVNACHPSAQETKESFEDSLSYTMRPCLEENKSKTKMGMVAHVYICAGWPLLLQLPCYNLSAQVRVNSECSSWTR